MILRHALERDIPTVVDIWVDAFAADPYLRWIQPDDAGWPDFGTAWMTFIAELAFQRGHTYLTDDRVGAIAWIPPDLSLVGPDDMARGRAIIAEHGGEERAAQALETILAARAHALEASHWTLQYLGVKSAHQSTGAGAALTAPILHACDAEGLPCGLVSTNARNISFYERLGFTVDAEVATPDNAAVLRPMHRPPSAS